MSKLSEVLGYPMPGFSTGNGEYQDCHIMPASDGPGVISLKISLIDGTTHSILMDVVTAELVVDFIVDAVYRARRFPG